MEIVKKTIDSLVFAEYNPRQLTDEQYQQLKDSITRFGLVDPIIVNQHKDRKNIIVGGHQRTRVAKKLGIEEVPCVFVNLPYEKERELNVRLNKNTGGWDYDILADMFDLDELIDWGFKEEELVGFDADIEVEGKIDDDEIPEDLESVCKLGDIWELGSHRLLCGDSTVKENIELLLDGNKADMVFTDPPYGINYSSKNSGWKTSNNFDVIKNDENGVDLNLVFSFDCIKVIFGAHCFPSKLPHRGRWLVWYKRGDGAEKALGSPFELTWIDTESGFDRFYKVVHGGFVNSDGGKRLHPTQKPVKLFVSILDDLAENKNNIVDLFLGSGSTLIACEKTKRVCYGMELDPHYCDVIINRWEQYTGKKARLVNGST